MKIKAQFSSMGKTAGMGLMVAGLMVIGVAFVGFPTPGGGGSTPERVCDLAGTITGHVHDDNFNKFITVSDLNLSPTNCRDKGFFDFSIVSQPVVVKNEYPENNPPTLPPGALLTTGTAKISVKAVDISGGVAREVQFTITTVQGETDKDFTQNIKIPTLVQGDSYTIQVNAPDWEQGQVKFTEQVTV